MAIKLDKSNKSVSLKKSLKKVVFSIDWNTDIDMDIHALVLKNGKATTDRDFVFYGALQFPNGSVIHSGDIRDGSVNSLGTSCETITVDLAKIPATKNEILFTADIYKALDLGLDFTDAVGSVCKITDEETNITLAEFNL
ncbi:MAG: TerD family protein, partial [Paraclostridium sp.]